MNPFDNVSTSLRSKVTIIIRAAYLNKKTSKYLPRKMAGRQILKHQIPILRYQINSKFQSSMFKTFDPPEAD